MELKNVPNPKHDYLEARGAVILADVIRDYWRPRSATVKVWIARTGEVYCVRSNLVNGKPPEEA